MAKFCFISFNKEVKKVKKEFGIFKAGLLGLWDFGSSVCLLFFKSAAEL